MVQHSLSMAYGSEVDRMMYAQVAFNVEGDGGLDRHLGIMAELVERLERYVFDLTRVHGAPNIQFL